MHGLPTNWHGLPSASGPHAQWQLGFESNLKDHRARDDRRSAEEIRRRVGGPSNGARGEITEASGADVPTGGTVACTVPPRPRPGVGRWFLTTLDRGLAYHWARLPGSPGPDPRDEFRAGRRIGKF